MAVKMRKFFPSSTRNFQVSLKLLSLQGLPQLPHHNHATPKFISINVKWKGQPKLFPFQSTYKTQVSTPKLLDNDRGGLHWDDDDDHRCFHNTCSFTLSASSSHPKFAPWEIAFNVLHGEKAKMYSKAKMAVIGRASINISEIACTMDNDNSCLQKKLPLTIHVDGFSRDATLTVLFNFLEIRETPSSMPILEGGSTTRTQVKGSSNNERKKNAKARGRSLSHEEGSLEELGRHDAKDAVLSGLSSKSIRLPPNSGVSQDSDKKEGWFSWRSRRFSFKRAKNKEEKSRSNEDKTNMDPQSIDSSSVELFSNPASQIDDPTNPRSGSGEQHRPAGVWEVKEVISRDGQARLKALVFFASFDQCSVEAGGESACTTLVAVISHWLHSNGDGMPNRSELDNLIMQGSSEWRKLCEDTNYVNKFPNKHFDLETVLRADVRPISILHNKSFVGFFGAETFESLRGVMSFDDIWNEISSNDGIYIISWNDHFFMLKAEKNAYYIIDTLGERLFEGCNQAFILRFDDEATVAKGSGEDDHKPEPSSSEIICRGKDCCREFIKRFLAAIPLKGVEEEEKKETVSYFTLHQRLQIEFNYTCLSSTAPSSSGSSPLSTAATSSPLSD